MHANQLEKFSPKLAELSQPLWAILSPRAAWLWGPAQEKAFNAIKAELANLTTLALYDPAIPPKISADASAYGLGAVLLQQHADLWQPVAFASRSMTESSCTPRTHSPEPQCLPLTAHIWQKTALLSVLLPMLSHSFQPVPTVCTSIAQHSTTIPPAQSSLPL